MEVTWGQVGFEVGGMGEVRRPSIGLCVVETKTMEKFSSEKKVKMFVAFYHSKF